jgi:NADH-quinone oxidoreductase subunit L
MFTTIVFLPLLGALIAGFFGRWIGDRGAQTATCGSLIISAGLSMFAFYDVFISGNAVTVPIFDWIESGDFVAVWALRVDALTAVMFVVVTLVSSIVHVYSIGYMSHDPQNPRFFAYLSLFTFAMLMLVTADNFVQLFFGWEGVGLASYLLIGFWYKKPSANAAAIKAFVVNRVGDFGFALGIMATYLVFDTVVFDTVFEATPAKVGQSFEFLGLQLDVMTTICLLLFMGAMGKSAQLFLHTWLPDAMEGPTPVSALIHAATMVTAGVFLVVRCSPMFEYAPIALNVVTIVGASTAFFAASIGLFQNDIKRVIAYSTCSQLGYMFFAAGLSAYGAAMFHLFTHAFFKALLFLGAGSVIHAMSDEQDMRNMGGIHTLVPMTWGLMVIGTLSLTGVGIPFGAFGMQGFPFDLFGTAGFYSKDAIIETAYAAGTSVGTYAFIMGLTAALMTSFYSWRLIFMTFHGPHRASNEKLNKVHESPLIMLAPLWILAAGALLAGWMFKDMFIGPQAGVFWDESIFVRDKAEVHYAIEASEHGAADVANDEVGEESQVHKVVDAVAVDHGDAQVDAHGTDARGAGAHHPPMWVIFSPLVVTILGFMIAWYFYISHPDLPKKIAERRNPIYLFLYNKWYFDELYDFIFVRPARWLARALWKGGDEWLIDGFGPDGIAARVLDTTRQVVRLQSGYLYHYAFAMLIGVTALATWYIVSLGAPQ